MGALNEVDEDNNIVGDQPFYYGNIPTHEASLKEKVKFVLLWLLVFVIIAGALFGIVKLFRKYRDSPST